MQPRIPRPRSIAAVAMSLGMGGLATLVLVTDASAHANIVSGAAVCTNGTYSITWTVHNDWNLKDTVTLVTSTGGGTISGLPETVAASGNGKGGGGHQPYATNTFTQSGIPGAATSASVTVMGTWTDNATNSASGSVQLPGPCNTNGGGGGGGSSSSSPATSTSSGTSTSPAAGGSSSSSAGSTVAASVTATSTGSGSGGGGSVSVGTSAPVLVQGVCTAGSMAPPVISIPGISGVTYLNGATVLAPGDHPIPLGASYTVTAVAQAGFTLVSPSVTSWTFTTTASASCSVSPSVLGVTFVAGATAATPAKAPPAAVLPFTGMPLLPTVAVGIGLLLAGALLLGSGRRHRVTRTAWTTDIGPRRF